MPHTALPIISTLHCSTMPPFSLQGCHHLPQVLAVHDGSAESHGRCFTRYDRTVLRAPQPSNIAYVVQRTLAFSTSSGCTLDAVVFTLGCVMTLRVPSPMMLARLWWTT